MIDLEWLFLAISLILAGVYLIKNNQYCKLQKNDLKMIPEIQLFFSGIIAFLLGLITLIKIIIDLF